MGNRLTDNEAGVSRTYSYTDALRPNRLTQMTMSGLNKRVEYAYDANGSLTDRVSQDYVGGSWQDAKREYFYYTAGGLTRQYVEDLITPVFVTCSSAAAAQSPSKRDWRYRYSATGEREQKRLYFTPEGDGCDNTHLWTYYLLGAGDEQLAVYNGRQTADDDACGNTGRRVHMYAVEYISYCGSASITTRPNGNKELNLKDHLGSVRSVVKAGSIVEKYDYRPFGKLHWSSSGTTKREGFIDKEMDKESNLGDFGVRKYDAELGRFLSVDPLWEVQPGNSPYHYAYNDPINGSDGSGMFTQTMVSRSSILESDPIPDMVEDGSWMHYGGDAYGNPGAHGYGGVMWWPTTTGLGEFSAYSDPITDGILCWGDRVTRGMFMSWWGATGGGVYAARGRRTTGGQMPNGMGGGGIGLAPPGGLTTTFAWVEGSYLPAGGGGSALDDLQTGLDLVGLIPVVGEWADGLNAGISLCRGDYLNASLSVAAITPIAGWGATGAKVAIKAGDAITTTSKVVKSSGLIKGYTKHGLNQAISRNNGRGVSIQAIADAVKNPMKVVPQSGDRIKYVGKSATVILSKEGKLITTFGKPRNP